MKIGPKSGEIGQNETEKLFHQLRKLKCSDGSRIPIPYLDHKIVYKRLTGDTHDSEALVQLFNVQCSTV